MIPAALVRGPVRRVLARKARSEVGKNVSWLAAGGRDRVAVNIRELTQQTEHRALGELDVLEGMVAQSGLGVPER